MFFSIVSLVAVVDAVCILYPQMLTCLRTGDKCTVSWGVIGEGWRLIWGRERIIWGRGEGDLGEGDLGEGGWWTGGW